MFFNFKKKNKKEPVVEQKSKEELDKEFNEQFDDVDEDDIKNWSQDEYNRIAKIKDSFERGLISEEEIPERDQVKIMKLYKIEINDIRSDIDNLQEENEKFEDKLNQLKEEDYSDILNLSTEERSRLEDLKKKTQDGLIKEEDLSAEDYEKIVKLYKMEIIELNKDIAALEKENAMYEEKSSKIKNLTDKYDNLGLKENASAEEINSVLENNPEIADELKNGLDELVKSDPNLVKEMIKKTAEAYPDQAEDIIEGYKNLYPELFEEEKPVE